MYDPGVGQRSGTETVIELVQAFMERRTWSQADLARRLSMTTPAVRSKLQELQGPFRLEREEDHPHVYWSVPRDWFPGGVLFKREQLPELMRQLSRLPRSKGREALMKTILAHVPGADESAVVPPSMSDQEAEQLAIIEDAAARKVALSFRYFTANRGARSTRHASVLRIVLGPPARFVALCHRTNALKWFRVESVDHARLDEAEPFRPVTKREVDAFVAASVNGFNAGGAPQTLAFRVREPEARWVAMNLPSPMRAEELSEGGLRITVETNAVQQVARFVVGLGAAAKVETPDLQRAVTALAREALGRA